MKFGIIGSGSWGTALAKILTDNNNSINWWTRNEANIEYIKKRHHNPQYLSTAYFDIGKLHLSAKVEEVILPSAALIIVVPSAYLTDTFSGLSKDILRKKKSISAKKERRPEQNKMRNH